MRIVFCNCGHADIVPTEVKETVLHWLGSARVDIEVVSDLCELAARRDPRLKKWSRDKELRVIACYPRAVEWLFHAGGASVTDGQLKVFNMRTMGAGRILESVLSGLETVCACRGKTLKAPLPGEWAPWFPVIDYGRCTNCKQCLSFCLFGVFSTDEEGRITVANPDHCKTNCPACSRVCPNVAIMFPKYDQRPINGDEVTEADLKRGAVKVDATKLMEGDIHAKLRARRKHAKERFAVGEEEQQGETCGVDSLKRMQVELGIPDEVIQSLGCNCSRAAGGNPPKTDPLKQNPENNA